MQCILTRVDYDLYYGGDTFSVEQPQSFTCPYCGKMGYTETSLQEHVTSEHAETSTEVSSFTMNPAVFDMYAGCSTLDEDWAVPEHDGQICTLLAAPRSSTYTPSNREAMDPIAELLSQLSGVRRAAGGQINSSGPSASQLQQLQMQLQLERQQAQAARQQVETGRHATRRSNNPGNTGNAIPPPSTATANPATVGENNPSSSSHSSQFLLARLNEPKMSEAERQFLEGERADRSLFVQELLLSTLMHEESSSSDEEERRDFADFGAMGCVDIMPLDVALENLQLRERSSTGKEPPPPPL
ncbi:hypothetical protein FQN60_008233 [Etheostoma spectabile]|uniref:C2H2-type domain-containing protein n=1 Tax=Etheostoma spectabile TaxID=54343 RepID=A0A5J5CQG6_9PERO|nr:hypothetical protein FQN60_008233 [Etheostoma spectabile]